MNIYETIYMLAAIEELPLEHTFFKSRYFPTDDVMDVFNTSKVLADYREGKRKKAPFVVPRIGSVPVGREGFKTYELEPAYIGLSMPLTIDQLKKRGFGESIMSGMTPEERAKRMQLHDMEELSARISRTEEWMACQTMLNNGCTMRHETDVKDVYEDVEVKFYDEATNPALFTPAAAWKHSTVDTKGNVTVGNWYEDIYQMLARQKRRGMPATDLLVSSDVGAFLMEDPWVLRMLDNRRVEMGRIQALRAIIAALPPLGLGLLVAGGVAYTAGIVFYKSQGRYMHFIWHLFVLAGSILQYVCIALYCI